MHFKYWLLKEESGVRSFKKPNPKNPSQNFVVLYGNTFAIKDQLKKMGFRYFQGTWSTLESKLTDEIKHELVSLGVDLSGLDVTTPQPNTEEPAAPTSQEEPGKFDSILQNMKSSLDAAIKSEGPDSKVKSLFANIERMIEKIAESTDEASKQELITNFLRFSSKFHNYSFKNQMLIWVQSGGKAEHVASATNWTKLGRQVKDWSKGMIIFAPNKISVEKTNAKTGKKEKAFILNPKNPYRMEKTYDISATDPIPGHKGSFQPVSRKDWSKDSNDDVDELNILINSLTNWIKEKKIDVNYEELSEEMGGYSSGGKIAINNKFKGINLFSTLVHETAHEILHWLGEKQNSRSELGKESARKQKEIDAETTAFIVCGHFGFETKDAPNYLALWRAKGDEIRERKQNIHKASKIIIEGIQKKVTEVELDLEPDSIEENYNPQRITFTGFIKDGRVFAMIDGKRKVFVTDAIYHNRWEKLSRKNPKSVYLQIMKLIKDNQAFEE
jgi:hypothetical protein